MAHQLTNNTTALEELLAKAQALPVALDTSDANAVADDIVTSKTAYVNGVKIEGANPYAKAETDAEVEAQEAALVEIVELLQGKAIGGSGGVDNIVLSMSNDMVVNLSYTTVQDGQLTYVSSQSCPKTTTLNVAPNTMFYVQVPSSSDTIIATGGAGFSINNGTALEVDGAGYYAWGVFGSVDCTISIDGEPA